MAIDHKANQDLNWIRENTGMDLRIRVGPSGKRFELTMEGRTWTGTYDEKHFILFLRDLRKTINTIFMAAQAIVEHVDAVSQSDGKTKQ